jgi:hypothetical protein
MQTPVQKLLADKKRVKAECLAREERISGNILYVQAHSAGFILYSLSSFLFPGVTVESKGESKKEDKSGGNPLFPLLWKMARPFLFTLVIKTVKKAIWKHK